MILKGGFEDVGVREVGQRRLGVMHRANAKESTFLGVEQTTEDRGAIEMRHAAPIDGAIGANQSGGGAIAGDALFADRAILLQRSRPHFRRRMVRGSHRRGTPLGYLTPRRSV